MSCCVAAGYHKQLRAIHASMIFDASRLLLLLCGALVPIVMLDLYVHTKSRLFSKMAAYLAGWRVSDVYSGLAHSLAF